MSETSVTERLRARGGRRPARKGRESGHLDTPLGSSEPQFMARWIGTMLLLACAIGAILLLLPNARFADSTLEVVTVVLAGALGITLVLGALHSSSVLAFELALGCATLITSLGVYASGSPIGGIFLFYLWISPYAFAFFSRRQASLQLALVAAGFGTVLLVDKHEHPAIANSGVLVGLWFLLVVTSLVIGIVIRRISRALRDVDRRVRRAFVDSPVGAAIVAGDLSLVNVNDAFCRLIGRSRAELIGRRLDDFSHDDDAIGLRHTVLGLGEETVEHAQRFVTDAGETVWTALSMAQVVPEIGAPYLFVQALDISVHKHYQEELAHQATRDPLTGMFNRTMFLEHLASCLRRPGGGVDEIAVIMLDLDRFKVVNDSLGHQVGDQLLQQIAPRLAAAVTPGDTLARFGGDEFVVLCDHLGEHADVVARARALLDALAEPVELPTGTFTIGASVGIALATPGATRASHLIRDADTALYRAKADGRGKIRVFDESLRTEVLDRLALEADMRRALERREIVLEFQPVVEVTSGRVAFVEALIRWQHPTRGRLLPGEFLPLAEDVGLIGELGALILELAVEQLRRFQSMPGGHSLWMSVNVTEAELADQRFADRVEHELRRLAIAPHDLGFEVTEQVLLGHDPARLTLDRLRRLGCRILLDNFGTGYASLSHLEEVNVDLLKVDHTFTARLADSHPRRTVLGAIVQMCDALSTEVVAEGVEEEAQLRLLGELGCALVQGRSIAPPAPPEQIGALLAGGFAPLYLPERVIRVADEDPRTA